MGHYFKWGTLKIIYLRMDCSADGLYRMNLEAPIMEGY